MSDLDHHMNELNYLMRSPEPVSRSLGLEQQHDFSNGNGSGSSRVGAFHIARRDLASTPSGHLQEAIKAVEIAESAIMEQIEENELLKSELHLTNLELQSYKKEVSLRTTDEKSQQVPQSFGKFLSRDNHSLRDSLNVSMLNKEQPESQLGDDLQRKLVIHHSEYNNHTSSAANMSSSRHDSGRRIFSNDAIQVNRCLSSGHMTSGDCSNYSQISSPSSRPASPKRAQREGDLESRQTLPGQGKTQTPDVCNHCNPWKEDLILKVKYQEEEILRLRKRLSDNAIKARGRGIETELKILNEKHILEKRIAAMRMAFDQQQQDLVDAASKALSYRQDIMEENIRLTYSLQDAEQERSIFISSLLPLLDEYDFRPSVNDAHSIVSNVKVLIQHLHEKLNHSEAKVKDSQFQLTTWRSDPVYQTQYAPQSPIYGGNDHMQKLNPNCLEIVPQSGYAQGQMPASPQPQSPYNRGNWESAVVKYQPINDSCQGLANDESRQTPLSPVVGLDNKVLRTGLVSATGEMNPFFPNDEANSTSGQASSDNEFEDTREIGARSPCLPTVQEEPNSSVSGGEDDLMPGIENLQIIGDALPGHTLQACGLSINGTSVCIFQWVRHLEDGSMHYIEGAAQPEYTVTADDVDALVAIECFPMDDRGRKGDLVKVFVNEEHKVTGGKISCDAAMRRKIESYFNVRLAVFDVQLSVGSFDIWEPAVLTLKKSSYEIKATKRRVVVNEKYSPDLQITIPSGSLSECVIICSDGREFVLATPEDNQLRDIIVLTLRLFMKQALERRKGKKVSFLNKIVSG